MLQMFHLDVLKVDPGIAHAAMSAHACLKCFHLFLDLCCKCLDISKVDWVLLAAMVHVPAPKV
jgi:hypothetical protein